MTSEHEMNFLCITLFTVFTAVISSALHLNRTEIAVPSPYEALRQLVTISDCESLDTLRNKLTADEKPTLVILESSAATELLRQIESRELQLNCQQTHPRQRRDTECKATSKGDGWCDVECNTKEQEWDGGDCCPSTCAESKRRNPCGSGGYQCIGDRKIPVWFKTRTQLCYRW